MSTVESVALGILIEGRNILSDVSVRCRSGTVTGLVGPNGSGKSTLLHVFAGLRRPSSGAVLLDGTDIHRLAPRSRARQLALVEQQATTALSLTAREVVTLGRIPHRSRWGGSDRDGAGVVDGALAAVGALDYADRPWTKMSGGERQRVHLARALAQQPQLLLLDEPTNHLDLAHQLRFLELVRELGITTLIALHDLDMAAAYCDDIIILDSGRVVDHGPGTSVLEAPRIASVFDVEVSVESWPPAGIPTSGPRDQDDRPGVLDLRTRRRVQWQRPLQGGHDRRGSGLLEERNRPGSR